MIAIMNIMETNHNLIVTDPKKELAAVCKEVAMNHGYDVKKINVPGTQSTVPMKFRFKLQDIASKRIFSVDSITDLGEPGTETRVTIRKNNFDTGYHVMVLERKLIQT